MFSEWLKRMIMVGTMGLLGLVLISGCAPKTPTEGEQLPIEDEEAIGEQEEGTTEEIETEMGTTTDTTEEIKQ